VRLALSPRPPVSRIPAVPDRVHNSLAFYLTGWSVISSNQYPRKVFIASINAPKLVGLTINELAPKAYAYDILLRGRQNYDGDTAQLRALLISSSAWCPLFPGIFRSSRSDQGRGELFGSAYLPRR